MDVLPPVAWLSLFADVPTAAFAGELPFWAAITGSRAAAPTGERSEFVPLEPRTGHWRDRYLWLQRVERGAGGWHPDFHVPEPAAAAAVAADLGAEVTLVTNALVTLASPAGQPFCFIQDADPATRRPPAAATWPDGRRSRLDQLCFDIPAAEFDAEATFWAALTGWPRLAADLGEFARLDVPDSVPVRILLQRLGSGDRAGPRAHADFACDDVAGEVARHVAAGARVEGEYEDWTTLRDPAGLVYCVTHRSPAP